MNYCIIMMATYNGEKYISEQIESILSQTHQNWCLCISDDGSTDKTLDLINYYCNKDKRIILYQNDGSHGVYCNFYSLIKRVKENHNNGDFYLFSDQDDIWDCNKLKVMINAFNNCNGPLLCYADMTLKGGEHDGWLMSKALKNVYKNPASTLIMNQVNGCNCIMNKELFSIVPLPDFNEEKLKILAHDAYYVRWAAVIGNIKFINSSTMIYRRHEGSVTEQQRYGYGIKRILERIKNSQEVIKVHAKIYSQLLMFLETTERFDHIKEDKKKLISDTRRLILNGGVFSIIYFLRYKVNCGHIVKTLSRLFILASGSYKKYLLV